MHGRLLAAVIPIAEHAETGGVFRKGRVMSSRWLRLEREEHRPVLTIAMQSLYPRAQSRS
jgi:hypothetical protein